MILFYGRTQGNSGPDNFNRALYDHLTPGFQAAKLGGSLRGLIKDLWKLCSCNALVVSGLSRKGCVLMAAAGILRKRRIYIMHGCAALEIQLNHQQNAAPRKQEQYLLKGADRILTVSAKYRDWVAERFPKYKEKLDVLHPGMPELPPYKTEAKVPGSILAAGADRAIKNNLPLARAVEELDGKMTLCVCGASYHGNPFSGFRHTDYIGLLPQLEYWQKLRETEIFVINSTLESFGLSALEALACGCSLLVSRNAGVGELLPLEEEDTIRDPQNTEELKQKLLWLHAHPNHARLRAICWTWEDAAARLEALCGERKSQ